MPTRRILFVEDNRYLLQELVRTFQEERPDWLLDFAGDTDSAWTKLCTRGYDAIVLDVMLPGWPGVPAKSEGIYLAKWILGVKDSQKPCVPPPGTMIATNQHAKILLLTSRNVASVEKEIKKVTNKDIKVIGRLKVDAQGQFEIIRDLVEGNNP